jgi:nitrogen fixation NifU-like protein
MEWFYTEEVKEHFFNPKNYLKEDEKFEYDGYGKVGNPKCGDEMIFMIKVKNNKIIDCRWKCYGCTVAIAVTSILSEMVKGKTLDEAYNINPEDIIRKLKEVPKIKIHCSVLGDQALRKAIDDYKDKLKNS